MVNGPEEAEGAVVPVRELELERRVPVLPVWVEEGRRWAVSGGCGRELLLLILLKRSRAFSIALVERQGESAWPSSPVALYV